MSDRDDRYDVATWGTVGGSYSYSRKYRWSFERTIGDEPTTICWIGCFPTKVDAEGGTRQSLARICNASRELGMGRLILVNLFSLRCATIADLEAAARRRPTRAIGGETDDRIRAAMRQSDRVIAAWGNGGRLIGRSRGFVDELPASLQRRLECVGVTSSGEPSQPGRLPNPLVPVSFRSRSS